MTNAQKTGTTAFVAVLIMFASNGLSRVLGFAREMLLAGLYGTGPEAAAYTYSFFIPEMLNHLLAGSALSIAFIPLFQELSDKPKERDRFFSNILTIGVLVFSFTIIILEFIAPQLILGKNITQDPEIFQLTVLLTRIILPAQLFFFMGALFNGVQYANKQFFRPAMTPLFYNLFIIGCGFFLADTLGIVGFAWGVLLGAFVGNVFIQIFGVKKCGITYRPVIDFKDRRLHQWFLMTVPLMLGLGLTFSNEITFRIFGATSSDGPIAIPALNYSFKLIMVFVGLFGQAIAGGIYPFLSQAATENAYDKMESYVTGALSKSLALGVLFVTLSFPIAKEIIALAFQSGEFSSQDTAYTATVFMAYLPGAIFFMAVLVLNRLFFAIKRTITPLIISSVSLLITLPLYMILEQKFGAAGIPMGAGIFSFLTVIGLIIFWKRFYKESRFISRLLPSVIKASVIGVVTLLLTSWLHTVIPSNFTGALKSDLIIQLTLICTPSVIVTLVLFHVTGVVTLQELSAQIKRKKK